MLLSILCVLLVCVFSAEASDWPQWRGPARDGQTSAVIPEKWPEQLALRWRVPVGSGHASPIVVGEKVYIHARSGEDEVALCLSLASGDTLWHSRYPAPYKMNNNAANHGPGPKSTPVVHGEHLYTLGISGILSAFDRDRGQLVWQRAFEDEFKPSAPLFGTATSPIIVDSLLVAHVGGHDRGALRAFDLATGETRWSVEGDGPAYTSPIVAEIDGTRQLITQSQGFNIALDPATGEVLWREPYATIYHQNVPTPVHYGDVVIFSGLDEGISAVRPYREKGQWKTAEVWHNTDASLYMSSAVRHGALLFGFSHKRKGQLFCLDLESGKTLWSGPGRMGDNALLVLAGDQLLALFADGSLRVVRASGDAYGEIAHYPLAESPTWAHPALIDNHVLIKDIEYLSLWSLR